MLILRGQKVSEGIAIGPATVLTALEVKVKEAFVPPEKVEAELKRLRRALDRTARDIRDSLDSQSDAVGEVRQIIETSLQFLGDEYLIGSIESRIRTKHFTAPYAVSDAIHEMAARLQAIDNPTFSSKVADMIDIEHRLLNHLVGGGVGQLPKLERQQIVIADDITPAQATSLDREKVLGFATERGSWASHTAVLARGYRLPAVVAVAGLTEAARLGAMVVIDGHEGLVIIDPDEDTLAHYRALRRRRKRRTNVSSQMRTLSAETQDGERVKLLANIETRADVPGVLEAGGEGVGLFRTEFLFLGTARDLGEEEQFDVYRSAAEALEGRPLTIRTIDVGADKFDGRHGNQREPNPFMGERAIRVSFRKEEFFRTQLRAIMRAAAHGNVRMMFPMIMDLGELRRARAIVERARRELEESGKVHEPDLPIGTMIELPSAALNAERIAKEADFFSIGTNDLTQYTLGVDRTNHRVADRYATHHPSVLRLIKMIVDAGRARRRTVSICGEIAGDPVFTALLVGLGVREFSMAPSFIPEVKRTLRGLFVSHCVQIAERALKAVDAADVEGLLALRRR
ncbi:MAG: phosphoenolpyruvate--protein phosphotransferase [Planctomycetota bacterium]